MKIVVDINHPGHVHYFKHFIWEMRKRGHEVLVTASEKDVTLKLLENYHLEYENMGTYGTSLVSKLANIPIIDIRYYRLMKSFKPDILVGFGSIRDKVGLVKALEEYGRVLITSEGALPPELEGYRSRVSPEKLHDLLYYATLYVGDGGTTASECAVLGTHAIYVNSLPLGYIAEEDEI